MHGLEAVYTTDVCRALRPCPRVLRGQGLDCVWRCVVPACTSNAASFRLTCVVLPM